MPVSGIGLLERELASNVRPPSRARGDAATGVGQQRSRRRPCGVAATIVAGKSGVDLGPRPAAVVAAEDVAAQAEDEHGAAGVGDAEEAAVVGHRERAEALRRRRRASARARPRRRRRGRPPTGRIAYRLKNLRIVGAVEPRLPGLAAVGGAEDQVVGADDVAVLRVGEPDVEERLVGALLLVALRFGEQRLRGLGCGLAPRPCAPSPRRSSSLAWRPSSCSCPGVRRRRRCAGSRRRARRPSPCRSSTKYTAVRSELTGTGDCFQVAPPSVETTMWPRWPTATSRLPAAPPPAAGSGSRAASICAGVSSTSTKPAAARRGREQRGAQARRRRHDGSRRHS